MSIEINTASSKSINWEAILSSLGEVQKADSVDGKESFTITTKDGDATLVTTINIPNDLEIPQNVDSSALVALVDKLASMEGVNFTDEQVSQMKSAIIQMCDNAASNLNQVKSKSTGSVMFDLYALMALMIEVSQSQRDASREMRTAENIAVQNSIQNQANDQRAAANIGMYVGIATGAATAVVSGITMAKQGVAASQQNQIMAQSGAESAQMHSTMLQNMDTKLNASTQLQNTVAKVGNDVANRVSGDFEAQLTDDQAGNLKTNLDNAITENNAAKLNVSQKQVTLDVAKENLQARVGAKNIAQTQYDAKTATVSQKQQAYDQAVQNNAGEDVVNAAKTELDAAKAEQAAAKTQLDTATQAVSSQNDVVANCQRDLGLANDQLTQTETKLAEARADYSKTVQDVAAQYQEKYQTAVDRLSNPPAGADKAQLKADVESARADMEMAFAKEADLLAQDNVLTPSQQKDIVALARNRVDTTTERVYQRADFKEAEYKMTKLAGINNINQAIGGVLQSMTSNIAGLQSAEATRQGAETTKQEELLNQTKDLFEQEQNVINQVIQLCSAVIQAENQSMRDAIQA